MFGNRTTFARMLNAMKARTMAREGSVRAIHGGRAGAGGYDFQARTVAFIFAHTLAAERLDWTEHGHRDCPLAVSAETGGTGDDIRVELAANREYEVQVKRTLSAGEKLREVAERFDGGLSRNQRMVAGGESCLSDADCVSGACSENETGRACR